MQSTLDLEINHAFEEFLTVARGVVILMEVGPSDHIIPFAGIIQCFRFRPL